MIKESFDVNYEIVKHVGIVSVNKKSKWTREVNWVSWNDKAPKLDIRDWGPGHERMGKGISLTGDEARALEGFLKQTLEVED